MSVNVANRVDRVAEWVRLKLSGCGERTNEKRQRAAAVQNLAEFLTRPYSAIASWSAAVLCRFFGEPPKVPDAFNRTPCLEPDG